MGARQLTLTLDDRADGGAWSIRLAPADDRRLAGVLGDDVTLGTRIRLAPPDDDTEGHARSSALRVRATPDGDDDTAGHAITLHFSNADEAETFRRRLLATGILTATLAVGFVSGTVASSLADQSSAQAEAEATIAEPAPLPAPPPAADEGPTPR